MLRFLILFSSLVFLGGSSATALNNLLNDVQQSLNLLHLSLETPLKLFNAALDTVNEKSKFAPVKRVTTEVSDSSEVITIVKAPQSALPLSHTERPRYNPVRMWDANDIPFKGGPKKAQAKLLPDDLARGAARYPPSRNLNPGKATQQAPSSPGDPPKGDVLPTAADLFSTLTGWLNG
ncbi:uncharacterized protein LOC26528025 [Drosophila mojavensis]|uniref:uncharacterized protein LOC26528025 n=1 Tax=Drosophila mojavensis TaxID=7230 RepID=UPI001CD05274|nr:uncharacterized protein LOC26528025 [Drosophila mojavensis]